MTITYDMNSERIVTLTFDMPNRGANVINPDFIGPLEESVTRLEAEEHLVGVVLCSAKKDWIAGADLEMMIGAADARELMEILERFKHVLRRLETLGAPVVAAINGAALGGGYEVALAAHHRIALSHAKLGLPEVKLGLLPGGGGTQRLSRLLGMQASLPYLLEGKELRGERALEAGFIHELAENEADLITKAHQYILSNPKSCQPWDFQHFKWPGGGSGRPGNAKAWTVAPAMTNARTNACYPAARHILACVYEGGLLDFDTACRVESRYFVKTALTQEAKNMIQAFWFDMHRIKKGENRPADIPPNPFKKIGVLGAGMMGSGIAYACAKAGLEVVLKDVDLAAAERGKSYSADLLSKQQQKGRISDEKAKQILARIQPTATAEDLTGCDLVIEAVFEQRELKARVTEEAEAQLSENAVFASNTSTLPITSLAKASRRPERFIGLHFFSPVDKMQLVEIIVGRQTSPESLAWSFDFVQRIGKIPIVVNDSRGFYTSRVFKTFVLEGIALLQEGQPAPLIENAGVMAGMPVGPLAVSDEVSISLMSHILNQTRADFEAEGNPYPSHPAEPAISLMVNDLQRPGRKAKAGFYDYPAEGPKRLWPELTRHFPPAEKLLSREEISRRLMFIQALEAARCHEEGVVREVADANIGSIFGWGFAPFQGGALQFINAMGAKTFVAEADRLAAAYGPRFTPPRSLRRMAAEDGRFV